MPYWVSQIAGSTVERIHEIVAAYRAKEIDAKTAWLQLAEIYCQVNGSYPNQVDPARHFEYHQAQATVDYMIGEWFPRFANCWFVGWPDDCAAVARQLEAQHPGSRFEVLNFQSGDYENL